MNKTVYYRIEEHNEELDLWEFSTILTDMKSARDFWSTIPKEFSKDFRILEIVNE